MEASNFQPKNTGKKQLFNNPVLEKLTRTHISVPLIIFYGIFGNLSINSPNFMEFIIINSAKFHKIQNVVLKYMVCFC